MSSAALCTNPAHDAVATMPSEESEDEFDATEMKRLVSDCDAESGALPDRPQRRRPRRGPDEPPCMPCSLSLGLAVCVGLVIVCVVAAAIAYLSGESGHTQVDVKLSESVTLRGLHSTIAYAFLGVPYAMLPKDRWQPPHGAPEGSRDLWTGLYVATEYGAPCPQLDSKGEVRGQENCLFLNVWTPVLGSEARRPVIVWLHGGHLTRGSGDEDGMVPGEEIAAQTNAVFVSFNYRLGVLGFLTLRELSDENLEHISGNYGLMDQLKVLRWVKKHIDVFGGDPGNVTLMGYEAGGVSALVLASSPAARGLFTRVMAMSASCGAGSALQLSLAEAEERGRSVYNATGCGDLACLRAAPLRDILKASPFEEYAAWEDSRLASDFPAPRSEEEPPPLFPAVVDGRLVSVPLAQGMSRVNVSVVLGSTRQEVAIRPPYPDMDLWNADNFSSVVTAMLGHLGPEQQTRLEQLYPADCPPPCPGRQYCTAVSDLRVTCPLNDLANATLSRPAVEGTPLPRVYRYVSAFVPDGAAQGAAEGSQGPLFAARGTDMRAFLGWPGALSSERDRAFTRLVRYHLMRFVSTDRMPEQWPEWPGTALLSDQFSTLSDISASCDFWRESSEPSD